MKDAETGDTKWVDTSSPAFKKEYAIAKLKNEQTLSNIFRKASVDNTTIATNENYVIPLVNLFKRRGK